MSVFRRLLSLALILVLLAALPPNSDRPARAQDSGVITIGMTDLATSLDPGHAYDFASWEVLSHLYTGLMRQIPGTLDYEPALAADYTISDDRLTYTFTLRDDAAFSDGTPITAQTVVDSINRAVSLEAGAHQAITPYVDTVSVGENGALIFTLKRPVPYFLGLLALPPYFPVHPDLIAAGEARPFADGGLIGSGPYLLESFDVGSQIVLTANPDYRLGPPPATPTIILKQYTKSQDLRLALENHEIDLAWRALFLDDLVSLESNENLTITSVPSTRAFYLYMNHDVEPSDDPLVREAITVLLNRRPVVDNVFEGYAVPLTSMVPDLFPDAYAPIWPDTPDLEHANSVLRAAAYRTASFRLNFAIETSIFAYGNLYVAAANELRRASFEPSDYISCFVDWNSNVQTFITTLERGERVIVLFAWTPIVPHPEAYLRPLVHSAEPIAANAKYARPDTDRLLDKAALLDDPAAAGELYRQVSSYLLERYDIAPLWQDTLQAVAWNNVTGVQIEPNFMLHYDLLARR